MIKAEQLSLKYANGHLALENINFEINRGEIVYLVGPSGSGKTSLLKLLMGVERPTSGELMILNHNMKSQSSQEGLKLRRKIGPVFQEFRLLEGRSALENVMTGMRFLNFTHKQMLDQAKEALIQVGLEHKIYSKVEFLSWGESQRVAIARAVVRKPQIIICDEPTGNLDHANAMNILKLLTNFKDVDTTVIITTHATHLINREEPHHLLTMDQGHLNWDKKLNTGGKNE